MERIENKEYYAYKYCFLPNGKYKDVEFMLKGSEVNSICHPGPNDCDVIKVLKLDYVQEQLKVLSDEFLQSIIQYYGATIEDYETREDFEMFLVWSAAWDIFEEEEYDKEDELEAA